MMATHTRTHIQGGETHREMLVSVTSHLQRRGTQSECKVRLFLVSVHFKAGKPSKNLSSSPAAARRQAANEVRCSHTPGQDR